jgi:hypothetical protein
MERIGCTPVYRSGAPGMVKVWRQLGANRWLVPCARLTQSILPPLGSAVCAVGLKNP